MKLNINLSHKSLIIIAIIIIMIILGITSCSIADYQVNKEYKQKQATCEHDWRELYEYDSGYVDIYCPKCQLQKEYLRVQDWTRIQIDMEYNKIK